MKPINRLSERPSPDHPITRPPEHAITRWLWSGICAGLAAVVLSGSAPLRAQEMDRRLAIFGRYLDALRTQAKIPGLSAAIVENRKIVWERGFGYQDVARRLPARPDTPYRIASLTKTFASTLLMQCVERRTLDLDASVRISPGSPALPPQVATVGQLLSHTSEGTPGSHYKYSGLLYGALTPVVESCTGKPFRVALADSILEPLGMYDSVPGQDLESAAAPAATLFEPARLTRYRDVLSRLAVPYVIDSKGRVQQADYPPKDINAAAGLISTVRDIARFDSAIDDRVLLSDETLSLAWTPVRSTTTGAMLPHALGWFSQDVRGERVIWHYGYWAQFSALYVKIPGRNLSLILLANSGGLSSYFPLGDGDITSSTFAELFLRLFGKGS